MNAVLIGCGKMGREIERELLARGHRIALAVDEGAGDLLRPESLAGADMAFEFTVPEAAFGNVSACLHAGVPVVCGTTGWDSQLPQAAGLCRALGGSFFYASNYSIGMNVMFALNKMLAGMMERFPDYDVTVGETHHTAKKDAPSGTALTLARDIVAEVSRKEEPVFHPPGEKSELEVYSVRRGTVAGTHEVIWESPTDLLEIRHINKDRRSLAFGAVLAAEFLSGRRGVYGMEDLLKFPAGA